jgi:hypothetical protein
MGVETDINENGQKEIETSAQLSEYLQLMGITVPDLTDVIKCENSDSNPSSDMSILVDKTESSEYIDVNTGLARVFNIENITINGACNLELNFEARGRDDTVFAIKKVYTDSSGNVLEYDEDHISFYCLTNDGSCDGGNIAPNSVSIVSNPLTINISEADLSQVRVIPLNGTIAMNYSALCDFDPDEVNFDYIKINSGVNCYGAYREKQILIPGEYSTGYSVMFDYALFNNGVLE